MRSPPYELQLQSRIEAGPDVFTFQSADGLVSKDEFRTAELLLANAVDPAGKSVLVVDGNYGVVSTLLGALGGSVTVTEESARAARLCERNARHNGVDVDVQLVADLREVPGEFDLAVYAPRPYDPTEVVEQRIADALARLRTGGDLFVAADRSSGGKRYRNWMGKLAGEVERKEKSEGCRVYRCSCPGDYEPPESERERTVETSLLGHDLTFGTRPGLFSPDGIDRGTRLLAETALDAVDLAEDDRLLDLACGYGPLGIVSALETDCVPWFTDDSRVATRCTRRNVRTNGVDPGDVVTADCVDGVEGPFDVVVSNPPTHAGSGITTELFEGARATLSPGGEFWLVYNQTLDYERRLARIFEEVAVFREAEGYAITVAER